jgi:hypothetical protein
MNVCWQLKNNIKNSLQILVNANPANNATAAAGGGHGGRTVASNGDRARAPAMNAEARMFTPSSQQRGLELFCRHRP